jgi:hypothetical protein
MPGFHFRTVWRSAAWNAANQTLLLPRPVSRRKQVCAGAFNLHYFATKFQQVIGDCCWFWRKANQHLVEILRCTSHQIEHAYGAAV